MTQDKWKAVDDYINHWLLPADPILESALQASEAAGLDPINVAPNQGKFLHLLAKIQGAKRILEIGTLGDIAPYGWPGPCHRVDDWSPWRSTPRMPKPPRLI